MGNCLLNPKNWSYGPKMSKEGPTAFFGRAETVNATM